MYHFQPAITKYQISPIIISAVSVQLYYKPDLERHYQIQDSHKGLTLKEVSDYSLCHTIVE